MSQANDPRRPRPSDPNRPKRPRTTQPSTNWNRPTEEDDEVLSRPTSKRSPAPAMGGPKLVERILFGRVSSNHLAQFCRQFSAYSDAGVDLIKSLEALQGQFSRTALGPILERIITRIRSGDALSDAMEREPAAFDRLFLSMIRVAEARGGIPETMRGLADHYDRPAKATDDGPKSGQAKTGRVDLPAVPGLASNGTTARGGFDGDAKPDRVAIQSSSEEPIPPPADGPGFPYLLEFYYPESITGLKLHQEVVELARHGYPIKPIDVSIFGSGVSTGRALADRYQVHSYPQILLVDGKGDEIDRIAEISTPAKIAAFYNANRSRSPSRAGHVDPALIVVPIGDDEPGLASPTAPKPWETVVRIKLSTPLNHSEDVNCGTNSGVVIWSEKGNSIILSSAHNLQKLGLPGLYKGQQTILGDPKGKITVDLFDGKLAREGPQPAQVGRGSLGLPAKLLGYDVVADLAVLAIQPGRVLPATPLVPSDWTPLAGMRMIAVGCSNGNDATAWDTKILDPKARVSKPGPGDLPAVLANFIKCAHEPKPGRSGGGLYTTDGHLAGICGLADPAEHVGLYVTPSEVRRFLGNMGLDMVFEGVIPDRPRLPEGPSTKPIARTTPVEEPATPPIVAARPPRAEASEEPIPVEPALPKPCRALVRIKLPVEGKPTEFASGTIVQSLPDRAVILTAAHIFFDPDQPDRLPGTLYSGKILVDLCEGRDSSRVPKSSLNLRGSLLACDDDSDLALVEIRPGRVLPTALIANISDARRGAKLITIGCSEGDDLRASWSKTTVLEPRHIEFGSVRSFEKGLIVCDHEAKLAEVGGGLFTAEGRLVGLCLGPNPTPTSYHVRADTIGAFLHEHGLPLDRWLPPNEPTPVLPKAPEPVDDDPPKSGSSSEPNLLDSTLPKPWETVVRIKMHHSDKEWGYGSGTIISSTAEESIILTCGHVFRTRGGRQPMPKNFRVPISVDLFGGQFVRRQPSAMLACTEKDIPGEAIDYDFIHNVGLIRIRPGRKLPASQVVPATWRPQKGMKMIALGCSQGNDATAWDTTILDPHVTMSNNATKQSFATIKCAHQPKEGRSGGGLYTPEGYVAGVCLFADPNEHVGLYATPEAIRTLLDRNGLARLYHQEKPGNVAVADGPSDVEPSFTFVDDVVVVNEPLLSPAPEPAGAVIVDEPILSPIPEPAAERRVSDRDSRLDDLERKLDRVLKALEDLMKGEKANEPPKDALPRVET